MIDEISEVLNSSIVAKSSASRVFGVNAPRCACAFAAIPDSLPSIGAPALVQMAWNTLNKATLGDSAFSNTDRSLMIASSVAAA